MTFGVYVHVPFCASRCGYCDFNTYTPGELGTSSSPGSYLAALAREIELVAERGMPRVDTVFIGGGTPSLLGAEGLVGILETLREHADLAADCEVTTESNPESTSAEFFDGLRRGGFTRISLGMQSTAPHVLRVLERRHTPGRALAAVQWAKDAGFQHINLDVIYATPGESDDDLRRTIEDVIATGVDHVSAYSLIVEDGTAMARKVRKGEIPAPDDDVMAARYEIIDGLLSNAGYRWYEVSNWAQPGGECRHNLGYWRNDQWWGFGPGAHSHMHGERLWNLKHPARYASALEAGELPIAGRESLSPENIHTENIMLGLRVREGIPRSWISPAADAVIARLVAEGKLVEQPGGAGGESRLRLGEAGRLLADGIVMDILMAEGL